MSGTYGRPAPAAWRGRRIEPGWELVCPVCYWRVPYFLLWQQAQRLALHLVDIHPYETAVLVLVVEDERARAYAGG